MGQHFLKNKSVLKRIARAIDPQKKDLVIEIGAGKGALTSFLVQRAGKVVAREKDRHLVSLLGKKEIPGLEILEGDALRVDFCKIAEKNPGFNVKVAGNIPYSISSPLLSKILEEKEILSECTFLLQKEFAERLCAGPGSKKYAPISILFQIHFSLSLLFTVKPESFSPPPKIQSALVSLKKRDQPLFSIENEKAFQEFLKGSFRHRRKTLYNNLISLDYEPLLLKRAFEKFGLEKSIRPEQLPIHRFVHLFQNINR